MPLSANSYLSNLPVILFGAIAIVVTLTLDKKIQDFRKEQTVLTKLKKEHDSQKSILDSSKSKLEIELEDKNDTEGPGLLPHQLPPELDERHVLFVCMRCTYKKKNCESIGQCKLENPDKKIIEQDMEDLVPNPKGSDLEPPVKPGTVLYHKLVQAHGAPSSPTRKHRKIFEIRPTRCLSSCDSGNTIALQGPSTKFGYQFAELDHNTPNLAEEILEFADFYIRSEDGYSKTKIRPPTLKSTIVSRIPPKNHYSNA